MFDLFKELGKTYVENETVNFSLASGRNTEGNVEIQFGDNDDAEDADEIEPD